MPYRRRGYRRRRPRGSKLTKKQKTQVKRLIGNSEELKAVDSTILTSVDASGSVILLAHPAQGDGVSFRNGDEIKLKKLIMSLNVVGADTTNICRFIIFRWSQNNNVTSPIVTDVLQTLNAMSMYNYTSVNQGKVFIVYDRVLTFSAYGTNDKLIKGSVWGRRLGKKILHFNAGTTNGTDQFYLLKITDSVAANHPGVAGYIRMEYTG